jgi:class 3 adenylate cyclase
VRSRLYDMEKKDEQTAPSEPQKSRLKTFLSGGTKASSSGDTSANDSLHDRPIADLFPEATVMFADIAGFTAWSSIREP